MDKVALFYTANEVLIEEDIKDICFALDIDYESLSGIGKKGKIRELIRRSFQTGIVDDLLTQFQAARPNAVWPTRVTKSTHELLASEIEVAFEGCLLSDSDEGAFPKWIVPPPGLLQGINSVVNSTVTTPIQIAIHNISGRILQELPFHIAVAHSERKIEIVTGDEEPAVKTPDITKLYNLKPVGFMFPDAWHAFNLQVRVHIDSMPCKFPLKIILYTTSGPITYEVVLDVIWEDY